VTFIAVFMKYLLNRPIIVVTLSKARNIFSHPSIGIVGSKHGCLYQEEEEEEGEEEEEEEEEVVTE
jgi:hypothetical protein